jgi:lipase maturation factor 1
VQAPDWKTLFALETDRYRIGRSFFLRGLGGIYLIAIVSWWIQAGLLVGENGLQPASRFLEFLGKNLAEQGRSGFWALPNLFWITGASDFALHTACFAGCFLALLVIAGRFVGPALAGLWFIYLSLVNTGGVFMSFQWDILLLETGFLALFLCRWEAKMNWTDPPPLTPVNRVALVFAWFLIAKLMFFSGWVKLAWSSEATPEWWPEGTAMTFHYMTQPLPTWTAWWMHQLPAWFHKASLVPMYLVEMVLPFAILFGRWGRLAAALGFSGLMVLVLLTGNFTYFNWLTIVLCLPLVQDRLWPAWLRSGLSFVPLGLTAPMPRRPLLLRFALAGPALLGLALVNFQIVVRDLHNAPKPFLKADLSPGWLDSFVAVVSPFYPASGYGLFRTMTTERPEILLEGSADGTSWLAYDFAWKVDEISDTPRFVAPHQPRVAWQFWFAALEGRFDYRSRNAGWFESLVLKLLEGDRGVKRLLKYDPFPDSPPRLVRARLMRYEFTTPEERRATGDWWKRVVIGEYLPEVSRPAAPAANPDAEGPL